MTRSIRLAESGWLPDFVIRMGLRRLLAQRAEELARTSNARVLEAMRRAPLALEPDRANAQHYELPAAFFEAVLGPRLKYSCGYFERPDASLAEAEARMLALSCERAGVEDGMSILDLGCGWGSLTLWLAEHFPAARITAVSNSKSQREFILGRCAARGIGRVEVLQSDVNHFDPGRRFDRVISIEMFEHVRNWTLLLNRVRDWLEPGGEAFAHVFCHRSTASLYEAAGPRDWMGRHFFTGGLMPCEGLFEAVAAELRVARQWRVSGTHYALTAQRWLERMDADPRHIRDVLRTVYGADAARWQHRWRLFFLSVAEFFGFRGGSEWFVSHTRLVPR